jgi:tetratricopeptide (TPR) repeat protein
VIALDPKNLTAYYNCAVLFEKQGDLDGAVEKIRAAVKISPDNSTLCDALSRLLGAKTNQFPDVVAPVKSPE